jgi:hypothetical protein
VLWAGKPTNNDEIGITLPVPVCCGLANLQIMLKLGFTSSCLLWAGKLKKNDEIRIILPLSVYCGLVNLRKMKLGFTYLFLWTGKPRKNG